MRDEIANLVYPVLLRGLSLKERLGSTGTMPDLDNEQAILKKYLNPEDTRRAGDFMGDTGLDSSGVVHRSGDPGRRLTDRFLGIRYALACWLDEIFILDSPWAREWTERKLETALFDSNLRATGFWEQARKAETREGDDALEVFFLCVMLGFQGDRRDRPDQLQAWINTTRKRLSEGLKKEPPAPVEVDPPVDVPPLRARDRFARMLVVSGVLFLLLIITSIVVLVLKGSTWQ
jgi:type IV/VI secretion system ImpK/VasF family protein